MLYLPLLQQKANVALKGMRQFFQLDFDTRFVRQRWKNRNNFQENTKFFTRSNLVLLLATYTN